MKKIYYLGTCDTCKRILNELKPLNDFEIQDIKSEPITVEQLKEMRRQLTSFDIFLIVSELKKFIDYNIEKIYQISKNDIVIKLKNIKDKDKKILYIKNSEFIATTNKKIEAYKLVTVKESIENR